MQDSYYMEKAIALAKKAEEKGEVPIGAVVVWEDEIVGEGYNLRESEKNALLHAEVVAIDDAVGLVLFSVSFGIASALESGAANILGVVVEPILEIVLSLGLGAAPVRRCPAAQYRHSPLPPAVFGRTAYP